MLVQFSELEEALNKLIAAEKLICLLRTELAESKNITRSILEPIIFNRLIVGDYSVTQQSDGGYWISHLSGESMKTSLYALSECIDKFWKENFEESLL